MTVIQHEGQWKQILPLSSRQARVHHWITAICNANSAAFESREAHKRSTNHELSTAPMCCTIAANIQSYDRQLDTHIGQLLNFVDGEDNI